jgi:D-3-phosphoglycerate dehydrogenase
MKSDALLVNVARGDLVNTQDLLNALDAGTIAAAALDVTDPEPLPDGHPLFLHPRVLVTPHVANPPELKRESFVALVEENCRRFREGRELQGVVDVQRGY